jgi:hypothetical protein
MTQIGVAVSTAATNVAKVDESVNISIYNDFLPSMACISLDFRQA